MNSHFIQNKSKKHYDGGNFVVGIYNNITETNVVNTWIKTFLNTLQQVSIIKSIIVYTFGNYD